MPNTKPQVTIGFPIYNGERYLQETLDSLLSQTFSDFELIIADNASTDRTEEICRRYAADDSRIRYLRNQENVGAALNHNRLVEMAAGEYFKWAAHDDLCAPEFLEKCVEVLDANPDAVLCYPRTTAIDENGREIKVYPAKPGASSAKPRKRYFEFVCVPHPCVAIFGVMRASALRETRLLGSYAAADRQLLGELSLRGRIYELPEHLFFYRNHAQQSWRAYSTMLEIEAWWSPHRAGKRTLPYWRLLWEHFLTIGRVPLSRSERAWCYAYLGWWVRKRWRHLASNLTPRQV